MVKTSIGCFATEAEVIQALEEKLKPKNALNLSCFSIDYASCRVLEWQVDRRRRCVRNRKECKILS